MIELIIFSLLGYWLYRQFKPGRKERWESRWNAWKPIGRYFVADVKACIPHKGRLRNEDWLTP